MNIFEILLYQPLLNILILIYSYFPGHNFGVSIVVLTVLIRLLLYPLVSESIRVQKVTADLQPKMKEIQEKHKNDKEKQTLLTMQLFKEHKINPFGGILLLVIQLPILIALYQVFYKGITSDVLKLLYGFVPNPGTIDQTFLGLVNLANGSLAMAVAAGILQYFQTKMITPPPAVKSRGGEDQMADFSNQMQKYMLYFFPVLTVYIFYKLPAALSLYWIASSLFSIAQQYLVINKIKPVAAGSVKSAALSR
jgi:YidC/Oxa1 family membrane protein insertase